MERNRKYFKLALNSSSLTFFVFDSYSTVKQKRKDINPIFDIIEQHKKNKYAIIHKDDEVRYYNQIS